jgi:hypothetical protein
MTFVIAEQSGVVNTANCAATGKPCNYSKIKDCLILFYFEMTAFENAEMFILGRGQFGGICSDF